MNTAPSSLEKVQYELILHEQAMSSTNCGITISDARLPDMPLIYINEAFERITGYSRDEVIGKNCRFLQADERDQPAVQFIRNAIRDGQHLKVLLRNYRKDGTLFWNELFMSPIFNEFGVISHFVGVQTDVTEREDAKRQLLEKHQLLETTLAALKETQTMLVHSEKMNALGQMVAGVAHEINNPISFINSNIHSLQNTFNELVTGYNSLYNSASLTAQLDQMNTLQELRETAEIDYLVEDTTDLIDQTLSGLKRVKTIVEELRKFSRLDEAEFKLSNLRENLESTLMVSSGELRAQINVELNVDPALELRCAPAELNQVFLNIIINAAQAIQGQGQLTISAFDTDEQVIIEFTDTGCGMPPEVAAHVFDPFFTTKPVGVGTGLGLSIAHKIIADHHQGAIHVASQPNQGTTFTIYLPKELHQ